MGVNELEAAVLHVLQRTAKALTRGQILDEVVADGFDRAVAVAKWPTVQKRLKASPRITAEKAGYRWDAEQLSVAEAFERLVTGRLSKADSALVEVVRAALATPATPAQPDASADMHAARALAELAIEVEELAAKQASARAMIHRVRARMKRMRLEPIDQAGDEVAFDRQRHQPIGSDIRDGTPVLVVRPGYVWKTPAKDVLIERPVVQE